MKQLSVAETFFMQAHTGQNAKGRFTYWFIRLQHALTKLEARPTFMQIASDRQGKASRIHQRQFACSCTH